MGDSKKVEQGINKLDSDIQLILFSTESKKYNEINISALQNLLKKQYSGIYVTLNKSYETIKGVLEKNKINTKSLIFIDAISNIKGKKAGECLFVGSPQDLTGICIAITEGVKSITQKRKFLVIDSISTLLIYNPGGAITKFIHFLSTLARDENCALILIMAGEEKERKIIDQVKPFFDLCIQIDGGDKA